jgi:hypothetical protein
MRTLPFDCYRCKPTHPADKCKECLRYRDMPGQTWGPRTPLMALVTPDGEGCDFIPHYPSEEKTK